MIRKVLTNQKGYTLVEVLAVTFIMVMVLGVVMQSFSFGVSVFAGGDNEVEAQQQARILMEDMVRTIKNSSKITVTSTPTNLTLTLQGSGVTYNYNRANKIMYRQGQIFAEHIANIEYSNVADRFVTIKITTKKGEAEFEIQNSVFTRR